MPSKNIKKVTETELWINFSLFVNQFLPDDDWKKKKELLQKLSNSLDQLILRFHVWNKYMGNLNITFLNLKTENKQINDYFQNSSNIMLDNVLQKKSKKK